MIIFDNSPILTVPDIAIKSPDCRTLNKVDLFQNLATKQASWSHPDPTFDPRLYAPAPDYPEPDFWPKYEALSYM